MQDHLEPVFCDKTGLNLNRMKGTLTLEVFCLGGPTDVMSVELIVDERTDLSEPFTGLCVDTGESITIVAPWDCDIRSTVNCDTELGRFKGWSEYQKDQGYGSIKFRLHDGYEHEHFFSEGESHQFELNPEAVLADLREFYEATSALRPEGTK